MASRPYKTPPGNVTSLFSGKTNANASNLSKVDLFNKPKAAAAAE